MAKLAEDVVIWRLTGIDVLYPEGRGGGEMCLVVPPLKHVTPSWINN